jgi:NAD(P)-dependent dehydrogenase (short-subunit alcohol dehydrogenase family)
MDVNGMTVLLTGASSGIGLATARLLAAHGARLGLVARSEDALRELAFLLNAWPVAADLSDPDAARSAAALALEHFGHVDVLINNAGQGYDASVESAEASKLLYIFRLHVVAPLLLMQAVIPGMRARREGAIVNVSSGTTLLTLTNNGPYSATKHALNCLSLTARKELARDNIRVSVVYPSLTDTPFEEGTTAFSDLAAMWVAEPTESAPGSRELPPLDPPELVAQKIHEAIEGGEAEVFAHERMRRM